MSTQLINRLKVMRSEPAVEAHLLFSRDYGIGQTLADYPHVHFDDNPATARKLARDRAFDAAIVIDSPEFLEALTGLPDCALITEVHTTTEKGLQYLANIRWETSGYIVPSRYSREILRSRFGIGDQMPVRIVPNSLDATAFPRTDLPHSLPRPIVGWVGKLDDHKNWRGLLDVAGKMAERGIDCEFWLIGGETAPVPVEEELLQEVYGRDLSSRFRWFPRIEYDAMHRVFGAMRQSGGLAIVTSVNESFGMSVLEALVCGCPVVASRVGALPELASAKSYLQFYESGDYDAAADLASALCDRTRGDASRAELHPDRDWLLSRFATEKVTPRYLAVLSELVQEARSS